MYAGGMCVDDVEALCGVCQDVAEVDGMPLCVTGYD